MVGVTRPINFNVGVAKLYNKCNINCFAVTNTSICISYLVDSLKENADSMNKSTTESSAIDWHNRFSVFVTNTGRFDSAHSGVWGVVGFFVILLVVNRRLSIARGDRWCAAATRWLWSTRSLRSRRQTVAGQVTVRRDWTKVEVWQKSFDALVERHWHLMADLYKIGVRLQAKKMMPDIFQNIETNDNKFK